MEVNHGWTAGKRLPPLGVLVYPSRSSLQHRKTCVFDVYTMKEVEGVNTLVTLDVFVAPIGNDDIKCGRDDFKECSDFDGSPDGVDFQQRNDHQLFVAACDGITRIVQACNALKKHIEDNRPAVKRSAKEADSNGDGGGKFSAAGHDGGSTAFRAPGGPFPPATFTGTVLAACTPMKNLLHQYQTAAAPSTRSTVYWN